MKASRILALVLALCMLCSVGLAESAAITDKEGASVSILAMNSWYSTVDLSDATLLNEIAKRANVTINWNLLDPSSYSDSVSPMLASGQDLPQGGNVFISVNDRDKPILPEVAAMFADLGFHLLATRGTARYLRERGLEVEEVLKVYEGRPNIVDRMINGDVALVINTASGKNTARDSKSIRHTAVSYGVPYCTTVAGAKASAIAIGKRREDTHVESLQEYYAREARG